MRLQTNLLIIFLFIAILPVVTMGILSFYAFQNTTEEEAISYLTSTNIQKRELIDNWLNDAADQIEIIAAALAMETQTPFTPPLKTGWNSTLDQLREEAVAQYLLPVVSKGKFTELFLLRPVDGQVILSTDPGQQGKLMVQKPFFTEGLKKTFVQNMFYSMSIQQPTMVISTPIKDQNNLVHGTLAGRLNLNFLGKIMALKSNYKETENSYLVNIQNLFVTNPRGEKDFALRKTIKTYGAAQALEKQTGHGYYTDYNSTPVLGAYIWLGNRDLALITEIEQEELLAPVKKQKETVITLTLTVGFIVLLFCGLTLSTLFTPLLHLLKAIREVGNGNLAYRPVLKGPKEITDLSQAFIDMTAKLQNTLVSRDELQSEIEIRKNTEGELKGALSKLKRAHIKLQDESRERWLAVEKSMQLAEIVENSINEIFIIDAETYHFIYANKQAIRNSGYTLKELKELTPLKIDPSMSKGAMDKQLERLRNKEIEVAVFETMIARKDSSYYSVIIHLKMIQFGESAALVAIVADVTERQKLESQLRQAQKMEAMGTLAGGIAHDFNNILAAILGYSRLVREELTDNSQAAQDIEKVIASALRASELVKQILTFSRKEQTLRKVVDFSLIVKESLTLLRASLPTSVKIEPNINAKEAYIYADPTQIHQVLINLCTNAAQAMEDGGTLQISLTNSQPSSSILPGKPEFPNAPKIMLTVSDSGVGIENNVIHRIFDPYFTTKEVGKGSGMGLAVVSGIVESHGGAISVKSKPGKGTTFCVVFPTVPEAEEQTTHSDEKAPRGTESILFVDDEEAIVQIAKRNLGQLGYKVTGFTSSLKALQEFKNSPDSYDLVITDQTMPEITGDQLSKQLLDIRPDLPVIVCSGFSSKMNAEKAEALGIRRFVMKPVKHNELAFSIRQLLENQ